MRCKCFAKVCRYTTETEVVQEDLSKWRPCMGCRSQWIYIQCGGFCSDCQGNNSSPIEAMKITFCSQIKTAAITKAKSRNLDRSPLSIKQSHIAKRLESSSGFKDGKENGTNVVEGKRQRKPAAPPALTPESTIEMAKPKSNLAENSKTEERSESEQPVDVNNDAIKNSVKSNAIKKSPPVESKPSFSGTTVSRKRKLSTSKNEPKAKKVKRASNKSTGSRLTSATSTPNSSSSTSTASGSGTPKKYASEPHAKFRDKIEKKLVEVKMAEDGTHNPDRLLYHILNNQPVANGEYEAEENYDWLKDLSLRQIDDFVDLNEGEKSLMKLWNTHLHLNPCYGDRMLIQILEEFIDQYGLKIYRQHLQKNFMLHLSNLHDFQAISSSTMMNMIIKYQTLVKESIEKPEKYPITPRKLPIENPYYKPKPLPLESLNSTTNNSNLSEKTSKKYENKKFSNSLSRKNNGKIFWLKKSFRKPVVNNNTDEDLKLWPRKKANVTFANELFIDDIHDLNEDSSNSKQSNFISDFNDMYKFTLISPRRNRRSKS